MKMKQFAFAATALFAGLISQAQHGQIRGGLNLANVSVTESGRVNEANQLTSFQVGVIGEIPLGTSVLSLQPGLLYTGKGSKIQEGTAGQSGYYKQTFNPRYLEVPVNLVFKAPIASSTRFFIGAGPYAAIGIGGDVKTEGTNILGQTYTRENDIKFSSDDPTTFNEEEGAGLGLVRRFDYGLNGTAGFEGRNLVLGVNYGLGLAKLQSGTNSGDDGSNKHRVLSVTLGFKF
ncbi:MAG: PorT family protein [Chitinophagaceae bacterium]|nr:MAG: PorT family protein [Chitinophagaceae bacterium]